MRSSSKRVAVATALVAAVAATSARAVPPPADGVFRGETAQKIEDNHVTLTTDANGHVKAFDIAWQATCRVEGNVWTATTSITPGTNGLDMTGEVFHKKGSYVGRVSKRIHGTVSIALRGRFANATAATGTWRAKVVVLRKRKGKFRKVDSCRTGRIAWSVSS